MSAHGIFGAAAGLVLLYVALALVAFVLSLMAMWGLYLAGKSQQAMASLYKQHLELVAFQTDYAERSAQAAEAHAEAAKALADRMERPQEVILLQGAE